MKLGKMKQLFAFIATAIVSVMLAFTLRAGLEGFLKPKTLSSLSNVQTVSGEKSELEQSASAIANNLLTDSILTIVQNYYVDDDRVDNLELLESGLYFLTEDRKYSLKVLDTGYSISAENKTIELKIEKPFDYDQLLKHSFAVSNFISQVEGNQKSLSEDYWQDKGTFRFLNTVLHSLDPHSSLLDSHEYDELKQGTEGTFGGLGVVVSFDDSMLKVVKTIENSPAASVGIKPGNLIVSINGRNTFGLTLEEVIDLMRGESGTKVDLDVLEDGAFSTKQLSIHRKVVRVKSVEASIVSSRGKKLLRLVVESFSSSTSDEVDELIETHPNVDGVILDLRSNPGGLLDQAVKVSDLFLEKGDIVSTQGRYEEVERARYSKRDYALPLVVLINGDTASASEIVAGSLQDNNRAIIIGQPSFGKGSVQTVFELPGGQALKLTVARYYTPNGISIQNVGVYPDIWLEEVVSEGRNLNLLGENRYLEERFLLNSLQAKQVESNRKSKYKYYYMQDESDYVLDFSSNLLAKVSDQFGRKVDDSYMRSSLWLSRNHSFIVDNLTPSEKKVSSYLYTNHDVNWKNEPRKISENLRLEILDNGKLEYEEGDSAVVRWRLHNDSGEAIERVSVVAKETKEWGRSFEKLLGKIEANSIVYGETKLPLPDVDKLSEVGYSLSTSQSSVYSVKNAQKISVKVKPITNPEITYSVNYKDHKGQTISSISPGSKGYVEISIKNNSNLDINDFAYQIFNLAGKQVQIGSNGNLPTDKSSLMSYDSLILRLPITVSKKLATKKLRLGFHMEALNRVYNHSRVIELQTSKYGVGDD